MFPGELLGEICREMWKKQNRDPQQSRQDRCAAAGCTLPQHLQLHSWYSAAKCHLPRQAEKAASQLCLRENSMVLTDFEPSLKSWCGC